MDQLMTILTDEIGLSQESARALVDQYGELAVQTHAMHCLYAMDQGRVKNPPAWFTASLKNGWNAPHGMPSNWLPTVLRFRIDENTFAEIERDIRKDKRKEH